ncbi:MAG: hypothetical protein WCR55_08895 [Lentisphaerota bacterium]
MLFSLGSKKTIHKESINFLTIMNVPTITARQNAAYDQAVATFYANTFSGNHEARSFIYKSVLTLLEITISARKELSNSPEIRGKKDPFFQYLLLLRDTIQAASSLVTHEIMLSKEEEHLSSFIGNEISDQFKSADRIFTDSELNIIRTTTELIKLATPVIIRNREKTIKNFSSEDSGRYQKAFIEFSDLYKKSQN